MSRATAKARVVEVLREHLDRVNPKEGVEALAEVILAMYAEEIKLPAPVFGINS